MPAKSVWSNDLVALDRVELGGSELEIIGVFVEAGVSAHVHLTLRPLGVKDDQFDYTMIVPKHWPLTIRRK